MGQYLKGNNMAQIKIHNGEYYAHAQISNAYNFCLSSNSTKFTRTSYLFVDIPHHGDKKSWGLVWRKSLKSFVIIAMICPSSKKRKICCTFIEKIIYFSNWSI